MCSPNPFTMLFRHRFMSVPLRHLFKNDHIIPNTSLQGESVSGSNAGFKAVWERALPLPCVHPGLWLAHLCRPHPHSLQSRVRWWEALTSWAVESIFLGFLEPFLVPQQACLFPSGPRQTAQQLQSSAQGACTRMVRL